MSFVRTASIRMAVLLSTIVLLVGCDAQGGKDLDEANARDSPSVVAPSSSKPAADKTHDTYRAPGNATIDTFHLDAGLIPGFTEAHRIPSTDGREPFVHAYPVKSAVESMSAGPSPSDGQWHQKVAEFADSAAAAAFMSTVRPDDVDVEGVGSTYNDLANHGSEGLQIIAEGGLETYIFRYGRFVVGWALTKEVASHAPELLKRLDEAANS